MVWLGDEGRGRGENHPRSEGSRTCSYSLLPLIHHVPSIRLGYLSAVTVTGDAAVDDGGCAGDALCDGAWVMNVHNVQKYHCVDDDLDGYADDDLCVHSDYDLNVYHQRDDGHNEMVIWVMMMVDSCFFFSPPLLVTLVYP